MYDDTEKRLMLLEAIVGEMIRSGILTEDMAERVAKRFDGESHRHRGSEREDDFADLAMMARMTAINASAPTQAERDADFRRRQMVERTALYEKQAREADGGNENTH